MDGGRGGGRGKGKKAKAAKKKAAAAQAQAQALAAQAAHKQKLHHSGKKVAASHASVQVVAVSSKASPTSSNAQAEAAAGGSHEPAMTRSKRKRLKKAAAGALLKKQAEADKQQRKKPPTATATGAASAVSPKTKHVAVLTPPPAAAAVAAVVKPHVVSLTGGKKKKRKRNAAAEESVAAAAEEGPTEEKEQKEKKTTVVLVGKASATPPSVAAKGKSVTPTTASPRREIAQLGSAAQKTKEQHVQKEAGVAVTTASPKSGAAASPRKTVMKMKAKAETPTDIKVVATATAQGESQGPVAAKKLEAKELATTEGETKVIAKKLQAKKAAQQQQQHKSVVVAKSPVATSVKADTATQKRAIAQVDTPVKQSPTNRQLPESRAQGNTTCDVSPNTQPTNEAATTLRKATKPTVSQATATTASTIAADDKQTVSKPAPHPDVGASYSSKAGHGDSSGTNSSTAKVVSESHGSVSTPATGLAQACLATPVDETVIATPPTAQECSKLTSPGSVTAKPSSPALPSGGLKRRRSADQGSVNSSTLQPPVKRSAVASEAAPSQPTQAKRSDSRDKRTPTDTPHCSSDQAPSLQMASTSQSERSIDTSIGTQKTQKERTTAPGRLTPPVRKAPPVAQNAAQAPANNMVSAPTGATSADATKQPKPPHNPRVTPSTTAPTKSETGCLPVKNASPDTAPRSRKVDIIMDSHSYVQKLMQDELIPKTGDCRGDQSAELAVALPPRPRNAWGASFGMAPPSNTASSARRRLSTTPLSSWFLSKGCANFIKTVHFSDNDDGSSDDDNGDISTPELHSGTPRGIDKASPKRRASVVKKNAFLESLKTQSNWRSWYGNVDIRNLLDPPLAHVPEKLQTHNVTPLELPEAAEIRAADKRASDLEMLEHDIRREKQRGSAFSEQLLMMLQGNTVSGKPLEEEYKPILQMKPLELESEVRTWSTKENVRFRQLSVDLTYGMLTKMLKLVLQQIYDFKE